MKPKQYVKSVGNKNFDLALVESEDGYYYLFTDRPGKPRYISDPIPSLSMALSMFDHNLKDLEA